ncbi:hypothetical protein V7068_19370 [Bacillus sp. JJ634]
MISNITKEAFYHLLKEAVEKGEKAQDLTVSELVKELSMKLSEIFKES